MSLPWVLAMAVVVVAVKVLPAAPRTSCVVRALLLVTALGVVVKPELARCVSGVTWWGIDMHMGMPMDMPM